MNLNAEFISFNAEFIVFDTDPHASAIHLEVPQIHKILDLFSINNRPFFKKQSSFSGAILHYSAFPIGNTKQLALVAIGSTHRSR